MIETPRSKAPVIVLALVLYALTPVVDALYYMTELERGAYPPNADSIGIPIFGTLIILIVAAPVYVTLVWASTRRYVACAPLTAWNSATWGRSLAWTVIWGGLAAVLLWDAAVFGYDRHPVSVLHRGALAYLFLLIRAAAIPDHTIQRRGGVLVKIVAAPDLTPPYKALQFDAIAAATAQTLKWAAEQGIPLQHIEPVVPFVPTNFGLLAWLFFQTEDQVQRFRADGTCERVIARFRSDLEKAGYLPEWLPLVDCNFSSKEVVDRDYEGAYFYFVR